MITTKDIKRWEKLAKIIAKDNEYHAQEILSIYLEKLSIKLSKNPTFEVNDKFTFISLRNEYLTFINQKEQKIYKEPEFIISDKVDDFSIDYHLIKDALFQSKLNLVTEVVEELDYFNKQLFILHFIKGMSQRKISRESGIGIQIIHKKIKKIKEKIIERYGTQEKNN